MNPRIDVQYHTVSLPPPYSYTYSLQAKLADHSVEVRLDWQYTDRDELSEEEIWEEGFTPDDDFQWQGSLPPVWKTALNELLEQTTLLPEKAAHPEHGLLAVTYTDAQQKITTGAPDDAERWGYQLQELIQGVYEAAQRERPLRIRYTVVDPTSPLDVTMDISFLHRRFTAASPHISSGRSQPLPWEDMQSFLETLYLPDYRPEQSSEAPPRKPGRYLDPGDERWYRLGTSVVNPGKKDILSALHRMILEMVGK